MLGTRVVIMASDDFAGELLELSLLHRGLNVVGRCTSPESVPAIVAQGADVLIRLATILDGDLDDSVFTAARQLDSTLGLVLLTTARDLRLLGTSPSSLPIGTRVLCAREPGGLARLATTVQSAAERPLAAQKRLGRLPLTDEQVEALRAVAAGLNNEELAERRSTSIGAARALVARTARAVGIRTESGPSQIRAELAAAYVRLVGGASPIPRP